MEEALRGLLLGTAALSDRVGTRIDWGVRSQGSKLPAITLHSIGGGIRMNLGGSSGWSRDRIQIDCWGRTFIAARDLADILVPRGRSGGLLVGFRGDLPGVRLRTLPLDRSSDDDEDSEGPVHRTSLDISVWHTPIPTE